MTVTRHKPPRLGLTLAETLVTLFLLTILLLFVVSTLPLVNRGVHQSQNRYMAALIGHNQLEEVRTVPFSTLASSSGNQTRTGYDGGRPSPQIFEYTRTVTDDLSSPKLWRKVVTVKVSWNESTGPCSLTLETVVAKI